MKTKLLTTAEVHAIFCRAVADAGGVTAWGLKHGISQGYVSNVLTGGRPITETIAGHLGLKLADQFFVRVKT